MTSDLGFFYISETFRPSTTSGAKNISIFDKNKKKFLMGIARTQKNEIFIGELWGFPHGPQLLPRSIPFRISPKFLQTLVDNVSSAGGDMKLLSPFLPEQVLPEPKKMRFS